MPRDPRSCTANSSSARTTVTSPCGSQAVTVSIQLDTGGSWCQRSPSQRATPRRSTTRTAPVGWRCTTVAPSTSASTTRSRSEPDGRSNTIHSSAPSRWRTSQLDSPSAKRRIPSGSVDRRGPRLISSCVPAAHPSGSVDGATTAPELTTRRSCTWGRRARSISSSTSAPNGSVGSGACPTSSASSSTSRRRRGEVAGIPRRLPTCSPAPPGCHTPCANLGGHAHRPRSPRSGRSRPDRARPRIHAVRGGRRRLGQDHRARAPRRGPGHLRGGGAARRSPPSPSPRRPAPSCATASAAACRRPPPPAGPRPSGVGSRSPSSTAPPSAPCTRSPSGCCPSTRWRRGSRRRSRCSTRSPRRWPSTAAGPGYSTSSSKTRTSSARSSCCTPPTSTRASCARSRSPSSARGTSWRTSSPSSAPTPRGSPTSCRRCTLSWPRSPTSAASASTRPTSSSSRCTSSATSPRCSWQPARTTSTSSRRSGRCRATGRTAARRHRGAAARTTCSRSSRPWSRPSRPSAGASSTGAPTASAPRSAPRPSRPPTSAGGPARSSSTTSSCWRARCCATRCRGRSCEPPSTSATSGSCSTSSRTPTRSRSSSPCASPPSTRSRPTHRSGPTSRWTPGGCSWWATPSSRSTGSAGPTSPSSWRPGSGLLPRPAARSSSRPTSAPWPPSSTG